MACASGLSSLVGMKRQRDLVDEARQKPVGAAHHRVLLVDCRRDAERARGDDGRQRGIAAKADHRPRLQAQQHAQRAGIADAEPGEGGSDGDGRAAGERGGRNAMNGAGGKVAAIFLSPHVGGELDGISRGAEAPGRARPRGTDGRPCRQRRAGSAGRSSHLLRGSLARLGAGFAFGFARGIARQAPGNRPSPRQPEDKAHGQRHGEQR